MYGIGNISNHLSDTLSPTNGLGLVPPMRSRAGNAFEIDYVPIDRIYTDEKNFQNRGDKYSQRSVDSIVNAAKNGTFNWFAFDPITIWENPKDGKKYVLSGHSRTQAFRELSKLRPYIEIDGLTFDRIPAKIYRGSFDDARRLALNSNTLATPETLTERAAYYRNIRKNQNITTPKELKALKEKAIRENNGQMIWDLSFLPEGGISFDSLKAFRLGEQSGSTENFLRLATICQWIGKAFQIYSGLSRAHDRELFNFLMSGGYGSKHGQFFSFSALNERLQKLYEKNVKKLNKMNADGEYTEPFQIAAFKHSSSELDKIAELQKVVNRAYKELQQGIKYVRDAKIPAYEKNQANPRFWDYLRGLFNQWINALVDKWKVSEPKEAKATPSLFGVKDEPNLFTIAANAATSVNNLDPQAAIEYLVNSMQNIVHNAKQLLDIYDVRVTNADRSALPSKWIALAEKLPSAFVEVGYDEDKAQQYANYCLRWATMFNEILVDPNAAKERFYNYLQRGIESDSERLSIKKIRNVINSLIEEDNGIYALGNVAARKKNDIDYYNFGLTIKPYLLKVPEKPPYLIDIVLSSGNHYSETKSTLPGVIATIYKHYKNGESFFIRNNDNDLILMFDYDFNGNPYFANEDTYSQHFPKNVDYQTQEKFVIKKRRLPEGEPFLTTNQVKQLSKKNVKASDVFNFYDYDSPRLRFAAEKVAEHLFDIPLTSKNIINVIDNMQLVMDLPEYQVPSDDYVLEILKTRIVDGLGKPSIKLEFDDNAQLVDFQKHMPQFYTPSSEERRQVGFELSGHTVNDKPAAVFNCPESELDCRGYKPTYKRLADYSHLIDAADGAKTLKGYGFEKSTLDELVNACKQYKQVERLAAHLKDDDKMQSAFNIWHWLHTNIKYNYDTPGEEEIRTPARTWADRKTGVDCDCLAVFTACLLLNMGYNPCFEIVAFNNSPKFSHIYVNLDGAAIDRVLPVFLQRPANITKTKIMEIPVYELSGVGRCDNSLSGVYNSTLAKIQSGTATGNDLNNYRKTQVLVTLKGIDEDAYKLAALLMPHIATIGDDGKYYFDSAKFAEIATKADAGLSLLKQQGASKEVLQNWLAEVVRDVDIAEDTVTATKEHDTIVIVINPKGYPTNVTGQYTAAELQTLTPMSQTATAQDQSASASQSPIFATTATPTKTDPEKDSPNWWLIAGIATVLGIAVMSKKGGSR